MAIRRRTRVLLSTLAAMTLLLSAAAGVVITQNRFDLTEEKVTITGADQPLRGLLVRPKQGRRPFGLAVFVHGDGPVDATSDSFYRPIWESLARAGYASLSWNKPGVGGAPGSWLDQSMDDRADETIAAIAWARARPGIDADRIGLWGASQAGWVMPKVAARLPKLHFVIAVSPAINWLRQGRYNLLAELRARHASAAEIQKELVRSDTMRALLRRGATFDELKSSGAAIGGMTPARWRFVSKNFTSDASADLAASRAPVLLMLGGHDLNVDVRDTEAGYRRLLREVGRLQVRHYADATHAMVRRDLEDSRWRFTLCAVTSPRSLFTARFLPDMTSFLRQLDRPGPALP